MDERLLFLLIGLSGKQWIDEIKAFSQWKIQDLEKRREAFATYVPNPAIMKGSAEAVRAIAKAQHQGIVAQDIKKLTKRIRWVRYTPVIIYTLTTLGLIALLPWRVSWPF